MSDEMHFHIRGICTSCDHVELYRTPLPDLLIAGDLCLRCGDPDMVGLDDATDEACRRCAPAFTRRLMHRWLHDTSPHGYP